MVTTARQYEYTVLLDPDEEGGWTAVNCGAALTSRVTAPMVRRFPQAG